jgi:hypothetical protein
LAQASAQPPGCLSNGAAKTFTITLPSSPFTATAGTGFTATVTALANNGCTATNFNGSGTLSSNLAQAPDGVHNPSVPSPINFVNGVSSPSVTAVKAVSDGSAKLTFSATNFAPVSSPGFSVNPGPPDHVEFTQPPLSNNSSSWLLNDHGSLTKFGAQVTIYDAFENVATNVSTGNVVLGLNQATGLNGHLAGGSATPNKGVATFASLTVDQTDIGYTLSESYANGTVTGLDSAPFSVYLTTAACGGACTINQFNVDKNTTAQVQGNGSFAFLGVATVDFSANGMPAGCQTIGQDYANGTPAPAVVADQRTALGGTLDITYGISKGLLQKLFGSSSGSQFIPICVGARRLALDANNNVVAAQCFDRINGQDQIDPNGQEQSPWMGKTLDQFGKFDQTQLSPAQCDSTQGDPGYGYWWGIIGSFQDATSSKPALVIDPSVNPTVTGWSSGNTYRFFTLHFPASSALGTPAQITAFANNPWDSWAGG